MRRFQTLVIFISRKRSVVVTLLAVCIALAAVASISVAVLANGGKPSKSNLMQQAAAAATARAQGPHAVKHPGTRIASCPVPWVPGIYPYHADEEPKNAPMNNVATIRTADGQDYMVAAGANLPGSLQGVLYVKQVWVDPCKEPLNAAPPAPHLFLDTHQDGSLTITQVSGSTIYFSAADGATGSFDISTDTYQ